jgi:hypothetical protein
MSLIATAMKLLDGTTSDDDIRRAVNTTYYAIFITFANGTATGLSLMTHLAPPVTKPTGLSTTQPQKLHAKNAEPRAKAFQRASSIMRKHSSACRI